MIRDLFNQAARCAWRFLAIAALILGLTATTAAVAQNSPAPEAEAAAATPRQKLTVATKIAPPFAIETKDGHWSGLAIELLDAIAHDLNRDITWKKVATSDDLVEAVAKGDADMGVAAVSITGEREKTVDFSHAYYDSGLAIAVANNRGSGFWDVMRALTSAPFLTTVSMLTLLLFITGGIIWFVEQGRNAEQFPKEPVDGIANGFWWSAVTMTTVGYGDKAPITPLGRAIAVVWMFAALILTAVFTAQLTTALTLEGISGPVGGSKDLPNARVGIVAKSATRDYFNERFMATRGFDDVASGLAALENGDIDAFVHDEPLLRYSILKEHAGRVRLLEEVFEPQSYGIVLPSGSNLREPVNQALLTIQETSRWRDIRRQYLGEQR